MDGTSDSEHMAMGKMLAVSPAPNGTKIATNPIRSASQTTNTTRDSDDVPATWSLTDVARGGEVERAAHAGLRHLPTRLLGRRNPPRTTAIARANGSSGAAGEPIRRRRHLGRCLRQNGEKGCALKGSLTARSAGGLWREDNRPNRSNHDSPPPSNCGSKWFRFNQMFS